MRTRGAARRAANTLIAGAPFLAVASARDVAVSEGSGQMVDEGAHNRRQAAARREDQVDNAVLRAPLREDMRQTAIPQFASAGMIRQKGHTEARDGGVTERLEIDTRHPWFVPDQASLVIRPRELPHDLAHLIGRGERRQAGERRHVSDGA